VDAQYYANVVDDYYRSVHDRNSFDNNGASMKSIVHIFADDYNNAFWNGELVAYGDGDDVKFQEFSGGLDVVGHEWTHAVTDFTSDLINCQVTPRTFNLAQKKDAGSQRTWETMLKHYKLGKAGAEHADGTKVWPDLTWLGL